MSDAHDVQESFFKWLSGLVSGAQLSELYIVFDDIEKACLSTGLLNKKIFETTDYTTINKIANVLDSDRDFRRKYRFNPYKAGMAIRFYRRFIKENLCVQQENNCFKIKFSSTTSDSINRRDNFAEWLKKIAAPKTVSSYLSAINQCSKLANENDILKGSLYAVTDYSELVRIKTALYNIPEFVELNTQQHNRFTAALKKLLAYRIENETEYRSIYSEQMFLPDNLTTDNFTEEEKARYAEILEQHFGVDGYQLGRAIFRGRFRSFYSAEFGSELEQSDEQIDSILRSIGIEHDGRIFPQKSSGRSELLNSIIAEIFSLFDTGATAVYPSAVFERYNRQLADELQIYTEDSLCNLLLANSSGRLFQYHSHITLMGRESNPSHDIMNVMREYHEPVTIDRLHEILWYIPTDKLKFVLAGEQSLIRVAPETYLYAPNFPICAEEQQHIISVINRELEYRSYITDVELIEIIGTKCPGLAINVSDYTKYGIRDCLGYLLREFFSFTGSIITKIGYEVNRSEIYAEFAREHESMTYADLKAFAAEMETIIYWDAVLGEMIRLNKDDFIRKDRIEFDISSIDDVLEGMCSEEYMPLQEINLFLSFPVIGYQWNSFVLEGYLYNFSKKFRLVHNSFVKSEVCGAMVKANSSIMDYETLITDVLAKAGGEFTANSALNYLVDKGYQAKRSYRGIENVIRAAKR